MNVLKELTYARIMADNRRMRALATGRVYRIAILSNVLVNALPPLLEWMFLSEGTRTEITQATFDNIIQESRSLGKTDAAIVFMDMAGISAAMPGAAADDDERLRALADDLAASVAQVVENLQDVSLVAFNTFSALPYEATALRDGPLGRLSARLNEALGAQREPNLVRVNIDKVYAMTGLGNALDFRQAHSARAIYSLDFFKEWVEHVFPAFRSAIGRSRKVLVTDCDNTLWGGIIGEDGMNGVRLDETTRDGPFFREAQHILKGLKSQGVLLAIASKNNPEDVRAVFRNHPAMTLREQDFVVMEVGWDEKIDSLRRIADNLNLGIDSLVFLDDSPFELDRVKTSLPQVSRIQVPDRISDYPRVLRDSLGLFFNLSQSEEDAKRTQMYRDNIVRQEAMVQFQSPDEYIASLNVNVEFTEGKDVNLARAAQMSQKTNQFNLTTRRYTEADIARMANDPDVIEATFTVSDRFGDYGITGLVILNLDRDDASASLDTFLMSCRVLGRKVEDAVMRWIGNRLVEAGCVKLRAEYLPTPKNQQVANLLDRLGFAPLSTVENHKFYVLELTA
jgi:FkbH-like protein